MHGTAGSIVTCSPGQYLGHVDGGRQLLCGVGPALWQCGQVGSNKIQLLYAQLRIHNLCVGLHYVPVHIAIAYSSAA